MVVSHIFYFHPYLGKIPILTNIFQMGWNHQLDQIGLLSGGPLEVFGQPPFFIGWFPSFTIILLGIYHLPKGVSPFLKWWLTSREEGGVCVFCLHSFFCSDKKGAMDIDLRDDIKKFRFQEFFIFIGICIHQNCHESWVGGVLVQLLFGRQGIQSTPQYPLYEICTSASTNEISVTSTWTWNKTHEIVYVLKLYGRKINIYIYILYIYILYISLLWIMACISSH